MSMPHIDLRSGYDVSGDRALYRSRWVYYATRVPLSVARILVVLTLFLIVFVNANVIDVNSYYGGNNWPTYVGFIVGVLLTCVAIPYFYIMSYRKFLKRDDFWDAELAWIMPIFYFGTFFQYENDLLFMRSFLIVSIVGIIVIHAYFLFLGFRLSRKSGDYEGYYEYFSSMQYLTVYMVLLCSVMTLYHPFELMSVLLNFGVDRHKAVAVLSACRSMLR